MPATSTALLSALCSAGLDQPSAKVKGEALHFLAIQSTKSVDAVRFHAIAGPIRQTNEIDTDVSRETSPRQQGQAGH